MAASLPAGSPQRRHILDRLEATRTASLSKLAVSADTEDFIEWVLKTQAPMKSDKVERIIEMATGMTPKAPSAKAPRKTGDLSVGETVLVDRYKNTNPANTDACEQYHNRVGMVESLTSSGVSIAFYRGDAENPSTDLSGDKQFFDGLATGKSSGLYRWTPKPAYASGVGDGEGGGKRIMFELVYLREGQAVDRRSIEQIEKYVEMGEQKGENRSRVYYTGLIVNFAYGQDGSMYFGLAAQQRDRPTFINPSKGKLLYIAPLGKRPAGWKAEAIELGIRTDSSSEE
jgi:hypothetical protein